MALTSCPECDGSVSEQAAVCPHCGHPLKTEAPPSPQPQRSYWGWEWKSKTRILDLPLIHVAIGRDRKTGKFLVAKGVVAIGQFALGVITIAQFGVGLLFGFGQFVAGYYAIGQVALGITLGIGQVATGMTAIGQFAFGKYVLAQIGFGKHVWSIKVKDPEAIDYFAGLWHSVKGLLGL